MEAHHFVLEAIVLHLNPSFHAGTQHFVLEPYCFVLEPIVPCRNPIIPFQPFVPEPNVLHLQEADMSPTTLGFMHTAQLHSQLQAIQPTSQHNASQFVAVGAARGAPNPDAIKPLLTKMHLLLLLFPMASGHTGVHCRPQKQPCGDKQPLCAAGRAIGQPHVSHPHHANVTISSTFAGRAGADRVEWVYPNNKHLVVV